MRLYVYYHDVSYDVIQSSHSLQTTTAQCAWWITKSLTDPRIVRLILPIPRVPMTMVPAFCACANSVITWPGLIPFSRNSFTTTCKYHHSNVTTCKHHHSNVTTCKHHHSNVITCKHHRSNVTTCKHHHSNVTTCKHHHSNVTTCKHHRSKVTTCKHHHSNVTTCKHHHSVKSKEGLWAFIHGKSRFSGLQSPLGITNGNRSHNKPLELIETI